MVLGCAEGMPWGHRAVSAPESTYELEGFGQAIFQMDGDGARAVAGDEEDNNDLGEGVTDGESVSAQLTNRAQADAKAVIDKEGNVGSVMEQIMGNLNALTKGDKSQHVHDELTYDMMHLPDTFQANDMHQDVANLKLDAKKLLDRVKHGEVDLGADGAARAQKDHVPLQAEAAGVKAKFEDLLGIQRDAQESIDHVEYLAGEIKHDVRHHEDEISSLGRVEGVATTTLPKWAANDKKMMGQIADELKDIHHVETDSVKIAATALQSTGTLKELGEDDASDNSKPKYDFEDDADEATPDVNAAQRSAFEDP